MAQFKPISRPWQVATIIGSVWGAFEIVAGSLLHNLAVPMVAGTILSALGVIIMVTGVRIYGGKGVFWRSALVCAALKTVSPSPVILSPMLGIALEGVLMELGVLLLGHNVIGYILGGGLALLSILGFKFVRLIMIYGTDLVEAYKSVFSFAFGSETFTQGYLLPILILVLIYLAIGGFAAYTGYKGGINIKGRMKGGILPNLIQTSDGYKPPMKTGQYKGGVAFLAFHIIWLIAFIALKNYTPELIWLSGGVLYLLLCIFRYGRVRGMLQRPTFIVIIFVVSIISSITISLGDNGTLETLVQIAQHGFTIFIRAVVVIISFSCIGIELMSKGVSQHLNFKIFGSLSHAYQQAHRSLPSLLKHLKQNSGKIHKPMPLIERLFSHFASTNHSEIKTSKVYIVTGDKHSGKTTFLKELVAQFNSNNIQCTGFLAEGFWDDSGKRASFNLLTIPQNISIPLCNRNQPNWEQHGPFRYNPKALAEGKQLLEDAGRDSIIIIDEIGKQELDGMIWADAFENLLHRNANPIVISARKSYLEDIIEKWQLHNATVVDASTECPEKIAKLLS